MIDIKKKYAADNFYRYNCGSLDKKVSKNNTYIVASVKKWHIKEFRSIKKSIPGNWHLIQNYSQLNPEDINNINPKYIFFPHWSKKVPSEIYENFECICFHETDLPYGRGGSPIQNLISEGYENTKISAIRMVEKFDAGPIYLKKNLSLSGLAEEIYIRAAKIIFEMIESIIYEKIIPKKQEGEDVFFKRRDPSQSKIPSELDNLKDLFDFIRMLDAEDYPYANLVYNNFLLEFTRPALRTDKIEATVSIKNLKDC